MGETEITKSPNKDTLLIGLCASLATVANLIKDPTARQIAVILAPPSAFIIGHIITRILKEINHSRFKWMLEGWIKELQTEKSELGLSVARRREIDKEIRNHKKLLQKKQLENLEVK